VAQSKPGEKVTLGISRNARTLMITAVVGDQSKANQATMIPPRKNKRTQPKSRENILGITVESVTPARARELGTRDTTGVVIVEVERQSLAENAGLAPGDIIRSLNQQSIRGTEDYHKLINKLKSGSRLLALIEREGYAIYLSIRIP
jgi:serine protease Do